VLTVDAELGAFYGDGDDGARLASPDLDLTLSLTERLQLGLETSVVVARLESDHVEVAGEPLWPSLIALLVGKEDEQRDVFALGVQAGPRLPSVGAKHALGAAALLVAGGGTPRLQVVANVGGTYDRTQTAALLFGLDVEYTLGKGGAFSLRGDVGGLYAVGGEPVQLLVDAGLGWEVTRTLELSLLAVAGPVFEGDRVGVLFGVREDFSLW